jgi:hypothetical protein
MYRPILNLIDYLPNIYKFNVTYSVRSSHKTRLVNCSPIRTRSSKDRDGFIDSLSFYYIDCNRISDDILGVAIQLRTHSRFIYSHSRGMNGRIPTPMQCRQTDDFHDLCQ